MAFAKSITVKGSNYSYKLGANVKHYTLRDNFFMETKAGNFEFIRPLESSPQKRDGGILKIIVAKDLSGMKLSIVSNDRMRKIDIFKSEEKKPIQDQFYFIMDGLVEQGVLEKESK